jgi:hypothetical protein
MSSSIRMIGIWSLFVVVVYLTSMEEGGKVFASDGERPPLSLEGLQGISVMILPFKPDAERNGLENEQLQKDIELKLRKAGIKILTDRELEKPGFPYLNIDVNVTKDKAPEVYSYNIKVELYKQEIQNPQDEIESAMQSVSVKTWSSELTGTAPGSDLKNRVQKQIGDTIDKFINDYLAANPKK